MEKKAMDRYRCLKETCGRLGKLFGEIAEALQGVASMEQATAPLAKVTEEDMLRNCISMLMQERDARGRYLVSSKCQWQAIYRILADHGLGVADGDYAGFERLAWRIQPAGVPRAVLTECPQADHEDGLHAPLFALDLRPGLQ